MKKWFESWCARAYLVRSDEILVSDKLRRDGKSNSLQRHQSQWQHISTKDMSTKSDPRWQLGIARCSMFAGPQLS